MSSTNKHTETVDAKLKKTWLAIDRMYNKEAAKQGATTATAMVLLCIDSKEGTNSTKIGPMIGADPRSLTRVFDSLIEKKLVVRKADKNDARKVIMTLTAAGKKKKEYAKEVVRKFNAQLEDRMGEKKLKKLNELLDEVFALINEE